MNKRRFIPFLLGLWIIALAAGRDPIRDATIREQGRQVAAEVPATRLPAGTDGVVGMRDAQWWDAVRAGIAADEYETSRVAGVLQAPNRAQGFRSWFRGDGVEIRSRTEPDAWRWSWRTRAIGRGATLRPVANVTPRSTGPRVEYDRDGFVEWYENRPDGLEQGFTIPLPPTGTGAVRIVGSIGGDGALLPREASSAIVCARAGGPDLIHYSGLHVVDATGRELPSRLRARGTEIDIEFEDGGARYPVTVDPLVTSPSWSYSGNAANQEIGYCVATAGDVNGDGLSDVIVGAPTYANAAGVPLGRVFVFLGRAVGPAAVPDWYASAEGGEGGGAFGTSVASVGDVNGDGYDDIVVGAPALGEPNQDSDGVALVWHGAASGGANGASGLGATGTFTNADWRGRADRTQSNFGRSVAGAGDVNGDGFADLIVGAPGYRDDDAQLSEGWAFLWLGSATGLGLFGTPDNADWSAQSNFGNVVLGWSVSTAGDVNADGYDDVLIGAPGANGAFLWLGSAADLGADGIPFNADWSANGTQAGARLGESVCTAGDVNGDGYADVAIGAPSYDDPEAEAGKLFVWLGGPTDLGPNGNPVNADWSMASHAAGARYGACVAPAGDIDGDGFADVLVGAPGYTNLLNAEGGAWAFRGSGSGLEANAMWSQRGNQAGAAFGTCVATAGDVNGDGFADVIVGAPLRNGATADAGWAGLYNGSARGPEATASWLQEGNQANAHLGSCVASAGDVNGDGYSDLLVGAPDYDGGQVDEGRVYLFVGQSTGLSINAAWRAEIDQAGASFGYAVSTAGDLNADGYADVAIGAPGHDMPGAADGGALCVWFGSVAGLGANGTAGNADRTMVEPQPGAALGRSAAWLGDVNGDGFSDVAVGAPFYDAPAFGQGLVQVYYGGITGIEAGHSWRQTGDQGGCNFGAAIAGAGDVNGDGLSDMIVGAPGYDAPDEDEGRAGVILGNVNGLSHAFAWFAESNLAGAQFGGAVAGAGDVDGDGYSDVLVGAPWWESAAGHLDEGWVSLYRGSAAGLGAGPAWTAEADLLDAQMGTSVATAGDVNGDGYSDVVVGAPGVAASRGSAYLWLGGAGGLGAPGRPANADWTDDGDLGAIAGRHGASVASAGDVDGDGFSDIIAGAPYADGDLAEEGRAFLYHGNSSHGQDRAAQQRRHDDAGPVHALGFSSSESQLRLRALGRSAGGRARVKLESEFRMGPVAWLPGGLGSVTGPQDTGAPGVRGSLVDLNGIVNLPAHGLFRWRTRVATNSPLFPHGPWLRLPDNAQSEGDIRLTDGVLAADPPAPSSLGLRVLGAQPSRGTVHLAFELKASAPVTLELFDASGRRVRQLAHGMKLTAGAHELAWDGRTQGGVLAAPGCYFARLALERSTATVRIIRVR